MCHCEGATRPWQSRRNQIAAVAALLRNDKLDGLISFCSDNYSPDYDKNPDIEYSKRNAHARITIACDTIACDTIARKCRVRELARLRFGIANVSVCVERIDAVYRAVFILRFLGCHARPKFAKFLECFGRRRRAAVSALARNESSAAFANRKTLSRDLDFSRVFRVVRFVVHHHDLSPRHSFGIVARPDGCDLVLGFARVALRE